MYGLIYHNPCVEAGWWLSKIKKEQWVSFKYERLPNLCYWCGCLTHADRDCDLWIDSAGTLEEKDKQYGSWLQAAPFMGARKAVVVVPGFYERKETATSQNSPTRTPRWTPAAETVTVDQTTTDTEKASALKADTSVSNFKSTFQKERNPADHTQSIPEITPTFKVTDSFEEQINDIDCALKKFDIPGGGNHAQTDTPGNISSQNNPITINAQTAPLPNQITPQPEILSHIPSFPSNKSLEPTQPTEPKILSHAPSHIPPFPLNKTLEPTQPKTTSHALPFSLKKPAEPTQPIIPSHAQPFPLKPTQLLTPSHAPTSIPPSTPYPETLSATPTPTKLHNNTHPSGTWKRLTRTDREEVLPTIEVVKRAAPSHTYQTELPNKKLAVSHSDHENTL